MTDAVAEQIAALRDEDWAIRGEAAGLLGTFKDPRAVVPLVSLLRDQDRSVREAAIEALRTIGAPAVETVGICLTDPDLSVQESASAILAAIADERVLAPLIRVLSSDDWIVRMHTAKALGRMRNADAVEPLIPLLQDKVKAVREEAAAALAAIGDAAIPSLLKALQHEDWLVRLHAVESLGKAKLERAVEPLLSVLFNDQDSAVREDAVRALGAIGDSQAVEYLFTAMREPGLRTLAVEALGLIGDPRAVPVLIDVLSGTSTPQATRTVAGCGDQWNEEAMTQGAAARALGAIGDDRAIPTLVAALNQTFTRAEAAAALGKFGSKVVPFLLPLLNEPRDENLLFHVRETLASAGWRTGRRSWAGTK
ncbi:MAG TPA: HEAT repeat domain-containing protein [Nitrospira sp.]|nr:HEAT repeat domain-containing protein [Nitrospira sp.]